VVGNTKEAGQVKSRAGLGVTGCSDINNGCHCRTMYQVIAARQPELGIGKRPTPFIHH
jgi:hypothetical protein